MVFDALGVESGRFGVDADCDEKLKYNFVAFSSASAMAWPAAVSEIGP